ncbi:MAG: glycosyltransferase family 4 protein, partial [Deltaproteobacteria bacterium]|nr:glycosyltransferase family 4 protein [Deltaproteobacteria bacterium]
FVLPALLARLRVQLYYSPTFLPPLVSPCPQAFTIHDLIHLDFAADYPASRRLAWRAIIGPRARRAHAVLTGSDAVAGQIARRLRVPAGRIEVIGHGLEASFRPRGEGEVRAIRARLGLEGDYLVAPGNRRSHKNLAGAVRAFQRLAALEQAPGLVIVGQAPDLSAPGPGRVIQAQELGDDELAALYTGARATIFASLAEGFGLPPLEALACGCPVVASDLPVLREVLGPEAALYTPPGDEAAMAKGLAQVLAETETASKRTQAGQAKAAGYTWEKAANKLRAVFDRLERD